MDQGYPSAAYHWDFHCKPFVFSDSRLTLENVKTMSV